MTGGSDFHKTPESRAISHLIGAVGPVADFSQARKITSLQTLRPESAGFQQKQVEVAGGGELAPPPPACQRLF